MDYEPGTYCTHTVKEYIQEYYWYNVRLLTYRHLKNLRQYSLPVVGDWVGEAVGMSVGDGVGGFIGTPVDVAVGVVVGSSSRRRCR